jgi:hypothetical protein
MRTILHKQKRGTVNGWTIVHIAHVNDNHITFESQDARINGQPFPKVEALAFAEVNWLYAVKFKNSEIVHAVELDRL